MTNQPCLPLAIADAHGYAAGVRGGSFEDNPFSRHPGRPDHPLAVAWVRGFRRARAFAAANSALPLPQDIEESS